MRFYSQFFLKNASLLKLPFRCISFDECMSKLMENIKAKEDITEVKHRTLS